MSVKVLTEKLRTALRCSGYPSSIVSAEHVADLQREFEDHYDNDLFSDLLHETYLKYIDFNPLSRIPMAKTLITIAVPQPHRKVTFHYKRKTIPAIIPSNYFGGIDRDVETLIQSVLEPAGYKISKASLPLKLLAAHSGLARYGKNNISYVDGLGSYHRLVAFYSDLPCITDSWCEPKVLERCNKCTVCVRKCPTGAISSDRFLIQADRCLTLLNEGEEAFPAWIKTTWHHCLVGCLYCQSYCPESRKSFTPVTEGPVFSDYETRLILNGGPDDTLPQDTRSKLDECGWDFKLLLLTRNLKALLHSQENIDRGPRLAAPVRTKKSLTTG